MNVYEQNKKVVSCNTEVVLVDIVGFSKLTSKDQVITAVIINGELEKILKLSFALSNLKLNEIVAGFVPTGDGFYVILQPSIIGYGLSLAISLRSSLLNASERGGDLYKGVRVASNFDEVFQFRDITGKDNYVGPAMNNCARLLSVEPSTAPAGFLEDDNFIIASEFSLDAHDKLYSSEEAKKYFSSALGLKRSSVITITDKHGFEHNGCFVECSKRVVINPPKSKDYKARVNMLTLILDSPDLP
jgi:hypothetical protein